MKREIIICWIIILFVGLSISPTIYADKNKVSLEPLPDLDCTGDLAFTDVEPGSTITGCITVENIGDPESLLDWEVESYPDWGTWSFDPEFGTELLAGDTITINVEIVTPTDPNVEFTGEVVIVNSNNASDFCYVEISLPFNFRSLEDEFVELDVEFYGLGEKHTVKITKEEYYEIELIFTHVKERLSNIDSDEDTISIFNEAIVKLDKYGLLGDLSVKQLQKFYV